MSRPDPRAAAWALRALDEHRSEVAFTRLHGRLREIGAAADVVAGCARIVEDERRHVALCEGVVRRLGGAAPEYARASFVAVEAARAIDEVAYTCVASLAIGESVSFALIAQARREAPPGWERDVTTSILRDEAGHGRFGFRWVARYWRELPYATRLFVTSRLPAALGQVARAAPERVALVRDVLGRRIVPRLEAMGVPAGAAWDQYRTVTGQ